ncbi:S8 family serine peptidase [Clostridium hydrogenum]|uniref:S8 family serine peptidase n=1 Tax=Clostridium hydrogenum TaxID=2855764 RepID=UPI001F198416|nr:S8 family serine peptidase [Clostridium hydrogenum]
MTSKKTRILSSLTAAALTASIAGNGVFAATSNADQANRAGKQAVLDAIKKLYQNQIQTSKVKTKNNIDVTKYKPDDSVRLIVQLNEKALKDYAGSKSLKEISQDSALKQKVLNSQSTYKTEATNINPSAKIKDSYYLLLNGFSVETKAKYISSYENMPGVKHVSVAKEYKVDPNMNTAKEIGKIPEAIQQTGYKGEGMVVAIIDTGIDATHKDMRLTDPSKAKIQTVKAGSEFSIKVPYGHNFADDNDDVVDRNPKTEMHGMHVAGIVGANGTDAEVAQNKAVKGVAPEAQLLAMKVFSNNPDMPSAFDDDTIAAIEDSVAHGADVINMSLGSDGGFQDPEDPEQAAISEAVKRGTLVSISAGNANYSTTPYNLSQTPDTAEVGTPGTTEDAITNASFENTNVTSYGFDYTSTAGNSTAPIGYATSEINPLDKTHGITNSSGYEVVDCGYGDTSDFTGKDLTGKIALIKRGNINFLNKKLNAQAAGAAGVIVYDNRPEGLVSMVTDASVKIPAIFISQQDGMSLLSKIGSGLKIYFKGNVGTSPNPATGQMSDFTSWGPTPDLSFKPEMTAPGGNIWSTANNNQYQNMSGTSMASPYIAGTEALILQNLEKQGYPKNEDTVKLAKNITMNTATVLTDSTDSTANILPYSPRRQGAGLVNALSAVNDYVTVTGADGVADVALRQISGNTATFKLNLRNYGNADVTYDVKDLSGVMTEEQKDQSGESYDVKLDGATVNFDKNKVTVPSKGQTQVTVTVNIPTTAPKEIYAEGYISFVPEGSTEDGVAAPTLGIPYMGFYGDWSKPSIIDAPVWDSDNTILGDTALMTQDSKGSLSYLGIASDGTTIDPDDIAISGNADAVNENVIPALTHLRNAKNQVAEIVDSNNNVVKTIDTKSNVIKNKFNDSEESPYTIDSNLLWDGKIYNSNTGKYETAPDGQYYYQVRDVVDYNGATWQTLKMPIKVDSTAPTVSSVSSTTENSTTVKLNIKASDNLSGVSKFGVMVNDDVTTLKLTNATANADGSYDVEVTVPKGNSKIAILPMDNAGNVGDEYDTNVTTSNLTLSLKNNQLLDNGNVTLSFSVPDSEKASIAQYSVVVDADETNKILTANTSVPLNLPEGKHTIDVSALDASGDAIEENSVNVIVQAQDFSLKFDNLVAGNLVGTENYVVTGSVTKIPAVFKIGGKDVTINSDLTFSIPVSLNEGLNKIPVYAADKNADGSDNILKNYSVNLYCDSVAPTVTLTKPTLSASNAASTIYVGSNTNTYTVAGTVDDTNSLGYNIYVNGEKLANVSSDISTDIKKDFSKDIALTGTTTNVEVKVVDDAGNTTTKTFQIIKDDTKAIKVQLTSPISGQTFPNGTVYVSGFVQNAAVGPVNLTINGQNFTVQNYRAGGSAFFSERVTLNGVNAQTIDVSAVDANGSTAEQTVAVNVTPEKIPPTIVVTSPISGSAVVTATQKTYEVDTTVTDASGVKDVSIIDANGNNVQVTSNGNGQYSGNVTLIDGANKVQIVAEDIYGNKAIRYVFVNRIPDRIPPTVNFVNPTIPSAVVQAGTTSYNLEFNATDASGVDPSSVSIQVNGNNLPCMTNASGNYVAVVPLDFGVNSVAISVSDIFGNKAVRYVTIVRMKDLQPPVLTILSDPNAALNSDGTFTIKVKADDNSGIKDVVINGVTVSPSTDGVDVYSSNVKLNKGLNSFVITAEDIWGNVTKRIFNIFSK